MSQVLLIWRVAATVRRRCWILFWVVGASAVPAQAVWTPQGPEFIASQTTDCHQSWSRAAASPADNGFLLAWSGFGGGSAFSGVQGIHVRSFDSRGLPQNDERWVGMSLQDGAPDLARTVDGYVVVWNNNGIRARVLDELGQPLAAIGRLDTPNLHAPAAVSLWNPRVAALPGGGFAAAWFVYAGQTKPAAIYLRYFDAAGAALGAETLVNESGSANAASSNSFDLAASADGSVMVSWQQELGVYARSYDADGAPGSPFPVSVAAATSLEGPALASMAGGFIAVWISRSDEQGLSSLLMRRLVPGTSVGTVTTVHSVLSPEGMASPSVAVGVDGSHVALWAQDGVFARFFRADGSASEPVLRLNGIDDPFFEYRPSAAFLARDRLVTTWTALRPPHGDPVPPPCDSRESGADGSGDAVLLRLFVDPNSDTATTLHLGVADRFQASVLWHQPSSPALAGVGYTLPLTADTGGFWFFEPGNLELGVKVLDGRAINGHFWAFYAALTTVEVELTLTDRETGSRRRYTKPAGQFASAADTQAFPDPDQAVTLAASSSLVPSPARLPQSAIFPGCEPASETLCLQQGRFSATIVWRTADGSSGRATPVPLSDESGYFWFFGSQNVELFVKILDGRALNDRYWVFYAGLTDVEFVLSVRDHQTGTERTYFNLPGNFPSAADTDAF
jgi:hypothetical protein